MSSFINGLPGLQAAFDAATAHVPGTTEPLNLSAVERDQLYRATFQPTVRFGRAKLVEKMIKDGKLPPEARQLVGDPEALGKLSLQHNLQRILDRRNPSLVAGAGGNAPLSSALDGANSATLPFESPGVAVHATGGSPAEIVAAKMLAEHQGVPYAGIHGRPDSVAAGLPAAIHPDASDVGVARQQLTELFAHVIRPVEELGITLEARDAMLVRVMQQLEPGSAETNPQNILNAIHNHSDPVRANDLFYEEMLRTYMEGGDPSGAPAPRDVTPAVTHTSGTPDDAAAAALRRLEAAVDARRANLTEVVGIADPVARSVAEARSAVEVAEVSVEAARVASHRAVETLRIATAFDSIPADLRAAAPSLTGLAAHAAAAADCVTDTHRLALKLTQIARSF